MSPMNDKEIISRAMSLLSKRRTKESRKPWVQAGSDARRAPVEKLEAAYQAIVAGETNCKKAAIEAKCSYYTLRDYVKRRNDGESPEAARMPKGDRRKG